MDCYVYYNCVSGNCPIIVEERLYGVSCSSCLDYCGSDFRGCDSCFFEGSDMCSECIHNK